MAHEPQVVVCSVDETRPKRQVSYNQDAVLCPVCKKRIRVNNDGRVRVHMAGKTGSDECSGSRAEVTLS